MKRFNYSTVLLVLLVAGSAGLFYCWRSFEDAAAAVEISNKIEDHLTSLGANVRAAESAVRGYALTGNPAFLRAFVRSTSKMQADQDYLSERANLDARLYAEVVRLKERVQDKLQWQDQIIMAYQQGGINRASALVNSQNGVVLMNRVGLISGEIESAQKAALLQATSRQHTFAAMLQLSIVILLLITAGFIFNIVLQRLEVICSNKERNRAFQELERLCNELNKKNAELLAAQETASRAMACRREFLANISHGLRTPLAGLLGATELVLSMPLKGEQQRLVEISKHCAEELLSLINEILDFEQIDSSSLKLNCCRFDLKAMLDRSLEFLKSKAREKNLRFLLEVDSNVPAEIFSDPVRIEEILVSLIDNAIKFTDRGTVSVKVENVPATRDKAALLSFSVSDTGRGIAGDQLTATFDPFVQIDSAITGKYGGIGLGLSISSRLARLMGGSLSVKSNPGSGSVFKLQIPLKTKEQAPVVATDIEFMAPVRADPSEPILLVEDNEAIRKVTEIQIRKLGCKVEAVAGGAQAIENARQKKYALILMDLQMPGVNGFMAADAIKESGLSCQSPIIAFTAHAMPADRKRCLESGMNDCLTKPASIHALKEMLSKWGCLTAEIQIARESVALPNL